VVSRLRDRISIVTAGRDHLTHRLLARLGSPRRVALTLAGVQAVLSALAVAGQILGPPALTILAGFSVALGLVALVVLDSPAWKPERPAPAPPPAAPPAF